MPDCDYCSASFEGEEGYDDHLAEEHYDELGRIDRRRVDEDRGDDTTEFPTGPVILIAVIGIAALLVVYLVVFAGGEDDRGTTGDGDIAWLPDQGDQAVISEVTTEPSTGRDHVSPGTDLSFDRVPPTSGTHYTSTVQAGFYEETQPLGALVHSLEHGAVVVYYDPSQLSPESESGLRSYTGSLTGTYQSFIAVPNPNDEPEAAYVLTAWEKRLPMDQYDNSTVQAFTAEYLGRGPERKVR